jgi:hypothetical protein
MTSLQSRHPQLPQNDIVAKNMGVGAANFTPHQFLPRPQLLAAHALAVLELARGLARPSAFRVNW